MEFGSYEIFERKVIIRLTNRICETPDELLSSSLFREITTRCVRKLEKKHSYLTEIFKDEKISDDKILQLIDVLKFLIKGDADLLLKAMPEAKEFTRDIDLLKEFVNYIYNFWRDFDRFIICDSTDEDFDKRPYRKFNQTIEHLTHLVRSTYRDILENLTGRHPRVYRQIMAGAEVATISIPRSVQFPNKKYDRLNSISMMSHILMYPPLILNPPMNKRTGKFHRIDKNPLDLIKINSQDWLCYPAKVGPLVILVYIHKKFFELGFALCNLFKLADDEDLRRKPDAVYLFGVPDNCLDGLADEPVVFYDDEENGIFSAAVPNGDEFGYFGYLKKMILTLHNVIMMKRNKLPYHGALVKVTLKGGKDATILFMGDSGAGKSETLEALRDMGEDYIQDMVIIADDMGSLEINEQGEIIGYGTEIGAFLRLDDLKPGYAFGQLDRAIIMSPNQTNARLILPVTTYKNLICGHKVDFIIYANNYETIDEDHPIVERFDNVSDALKVFREGSVMSKGTTTTSGIVHSYFANIFGPPQYRHLHDPLAEKYFAAFFAADVWVGQMRTRLGLGGWERKGPEEASQEVLRVISGS